MTASLVGDAASVARGPAWATLAASPTSQARPVSMVHCRQTVQCRARADRRQRMRAVVQRVRRARVVIAGEVAGEIGAGLLVLLGVTRADTEEQARWLAEKII